MDDTCGQEHPDLPGVTCDKHPHPYGWHANRGSGAAWAGLEPPARKKTKATTRVQQIASQVASSPASRRVGPPPAGMSEADRQVLAEQAWQRDRAQWLGQARDAIHRVCLERDTLTLGDVWPLLDDTPERRAMVLAVRYARSQGWMEETGTAVRPQSDWVTRDGVRFPLNKYVPVYRSLLRG